MSLKDLANNGVLRVAVNTGNRALVQQVDGELKGVSPALGKKLAQELSAQFDPIIYDGAGKVFADAQNDVWDVGFLAIDSKRAEKISFTRPYITIEATYAVRSDTEITDIEEVDKKDLVVLTAVGSAYDMHLTKTLKHATLERFGTPPQSFQAFKEGRCDAVAGVRESLSGFFVNDPNVRILSGVLTSVQQAMALPNPNNPLIGELDTFVAQIIADGFVEQAL